MTTGTTDTPLIPPAAQTAPLFSRAGRAALTRMSAVCAVALLALACFCFQPRYLPLHGAAVWLMLASGAFLGVAVGLGRGSVGTTPASSAAAMSLAAIDEPCRLTPARHLWWIPLLVGAGMLYAVATVSAGHFVFLFPQGMDHDVQMTLIIGSVALMVWGGGGLPLPVWRRGDEFRQQTGDEDTKRTGDEGTKRTWQAMSLLVITLVGLAARLWQLEHAVHFMVDELNFALGVASFRGSYNIELYRPLVMSFPAFFSWYQAGAAYLFGNNLFALRLPGAVIGALTIPAVYLLAGALFPGRRGLALTAALCLAVLPPHIHFSRLGINNIVDPLFGTLALAFLLRGFRNHHRIEFALAGAMLGMTQYFYEGGRVIFPVLTLLLIGWSLLATVGAAQGRARRRLILRGSGLALLLAALVAFPVYYTQWARGLPALTRLADNRFDLTYWVALILSDADSTIVHLHLNHVLSPFLIWMNRPEQSLFYAGGLPLLLAYVAVPFLLGVWQTLWRPRNGGLWLLLGWLLLTAFGNTLLKDSLQAPRYVVVFPAVAIMIAAGIWDTAALVFAGVGTRYTVSASGGGDAEGDGERTNDSDVGVGVWRAKPLRNMSLFVGVVILLLAAGQLHYYFNPYLAEYNRHFRAVDPAPDGQDALLRSVAFPAWAQIHLISDPPVDEAYHEGLAAYLTNVFVVESLSAADFGTNYIDSLSFANADHAFFVAPDQPEAMELLMDHFGAAPQSTPFDVPPDEAFVLFYVPREWWVEGAE